MRDPNISVVITARNYAKYLPQCINSVLCQNYEDYEVIIVNDGSTDNTEDVLHRYADHPAIHILRSSGIGLAAASNLGIRKSRGQYIIRLDADDYFDENILLVESHILDRNVDVGMVYPDYYRINKHGEIIDYTRLMKVNDEVTLLNRSPLAAGAMFRRHCYESLGGYNEELRYQEDYDYWIRFVDRYQVYNVNVPLMYYRQHDASMSTNKKPRMAARRHVKKTFVERNRVFPKGRISAVLPVVGKNLADGKYALKPILGKPLIAYTIEEALKVTHMSEVIVSTEDEEIASVAREYGAMVPFLRPRELSNPAVTMEQVLNHLLDHINSVDGDQPAMLMVLHVHSPLRSERHLTEAIHTLLLDDVDSVIGVVEDLTFHWKPGPQGLIPVGYPKRILRQDRETIYKESGGIYLVKCENVMKGQMLGARVGHIELQWDDAYRVENEQDFVIAEMILRERMGNESTGSDTGKTRITGDSSKKYISGLGEASRELYLRVSDSV